MSTFNIEITETLSRTLSIEASSLEDALQIAKEKYEAEEVVLDSQDYVDTEFKTIN